MYQRLIVLFSCWIVAFVSPQAQTAKPDLAMMEFIRSPINSTSATVSNQNPPILAGGSVSATGTLQNLGTANSPATKLRFYLSTDIMYGISDVLLGFVNGNALTPNQMQFLLEQSIAIPATTAAGIYYVLARVDADSQASESNENNNVFNFQVTVVSSTTPDLVAYMPIAPASAMRNTPISVSCRVKNKGANTATTTSLKCYISSDTSYSTNDVQVGAASVASIIGGSYLSKTVSITIPNSVSIGSKFLLFRCDAASQVTEANENNNVSSKSITVN